MKTQDFLKKKQKADVANNTGWLDTENMKKDGIKPSQFIEQRFTGYQRPENPFKECQTKNPRRTH